MRSRKDETVGFCVQRKQCATCIYRASNPLDTKQLEADVSDRYGFTTYRQCHHTEATSVCCRGFWDRHKDKFHAGQLAQRLNAVEFVDIDEL